MDHEQAIEHLDTLDEIMDIKDASVNTNKVDIIRLCTILHDIISTLNPLAAARQHKVEPLVSKEK